MLDYLNIYNSIFKENNGNVEGGAIKWSWNVPFIENTLFEQNNAFYGNDQAGYPLRMKMKLWERCKIVF